jgi:hypothetical protein
MTTKIREIKEAAFKLRKSYMDWARSEKELQEVIREFKKAMRRAS